MTTEEKDQTTADRTEAAEGTAAEDTAGTYTNEAESEAGSEPETTTAGNDQLAELRKQAEENYQRSLRVQADFDNFRRRSRQEKEEFAKYASLKLIEQLLPVVDNFERAMAASKEVQDFEALLKGIEMTSRQLEQVLTNEGLQPIEAVGQPFNPDVHQAIMQVESDEHEEGIVVEEIQKGYMLKDKVIRPALVKVSM